MKTALITGITGQDGAYLAKFLLEKDYKIFGTFRRLSTPNFWRLQYLEIFDKVNLVPADLADSSSLLEAVKISSPDEIYNLAAQSFVGTSFEQPIATAEITGLGVARILESLREINPKVKFYQASTSELYGERKIRIRDENTAFKPASPYGAAKLYGYWMTSIYRKAYGVFACNGILFNHESPLRGLEFVTRKITNAVAKISLGLENELSLGNIEARRDWGYAPDFVEAMWLILQQNKPDDYVIATGETHSVKEFARESFGIVGLDWKKYVKYDQKFKRPYDINLLRGDFSKAQKKFGWKPRVTFKQLVKIMLEEDIKRWKMCQKGKKFPWDAYNYPSEARILTTSLKT